MIKKNISPFAVTSFLLDFHFLLMIHQNLTCYYFIVYDCFNHYFIVTELEIMLFNADFASFSLNYFPFLKLSAEGSSCIPHSPFSIGLKFESSVRKLAGNEITN
jgi:hypothetical protein